MPRRNDHSADQIKAMILEAGTELIRENGIDGLRARPIAERIGYAVGTLYNAFDDLNDIVEHINAITARRLFEACVSEPIPDQPGEALLALANRYCRFVEDNSRLWRAVVAYPFPLHHQRSEVYLAEVQKVFQLIYDATAPLYGSGEAAKQTHDARVLWACLYGVQALHEASRYPDGETLENMVSTVVRMYLASRERGERT